ncbi:glucose-6-phosphate dehydrogenase (coenzyme-F420) [Amycolatopsis sp. AA4]|uniref:glucose-6-phosphate dehydrogenase (coenzyme-F420) n=1 Tax=Actinomycetes TaxID=1760 RepID=UPI0001B53A84|nr:MULTISPECIES: glucose-6-phosphate dehydrogenase (coenzyme-F420) [Actinomycetes]ATY11990.1 glucose-6-phosphate dehydrogenase (coenzyme-F420) [Amycolatopsis sp. AA4]EFL07687.1 glucose-6-phosphate dehydrogenase, F420-dependent [Streptomyces sp. AA4]
MDTRTSGITIGYKASAEQFGPRHLVELAVLAERRGFDSVLVSDHYQPWRHRNGHAPFSMAWLAAAGERTERVRLGTSVLTATFRYHPAVVAQAFGTLGALCPGRVMLGLGTGEALNEVAVARMEWPGFEERFARLREAIDLIRRLWTEERVSFDGEYYRTENATVYDRPSRPVPVYVAAGGPVVAKYAGRIADGFICTSGKGMELYTEKLQPAVDAGAEQAGREPADVARTIEIKLSYDTDAEAAAENTRFWAPLSLTADQKHGVSDPLAMERAADELPMSQIASRWIVSSDPDEVVERIRPYVDAGFTDLVLHAPGHDQARFLELARQDLLPRLRNLGG